MGCFAGVVLERTCDVRNISCVVDVTPAFVPLAYLHWALLVFTNYTLVLAPLAFFPDHTKELLVMFWLLLAASSRLQPIGRALQFLLDRTDDDDSCLVFW